MAAALAALPVPPVLPPPVAEVAPVEAGEASVATLATAVAETGVLEDGPAWPSDEAESAYRAEARARGEEGAVMAALDHAEAEEEKQTLPTVEELVARLPADVRTTLDELFRARFVRAIRVRKKDLK